jgi:hypothetical protein
MAWVASQTNGSMYRHSLLREQVKSGLLNRLNPEAAETRACFTTATN